MPTTRTGNVVSMIFLWTRVIPFMLALAILSPIFGPAPLPVWGAFPQSLVSVTYLSYAVLLLVLAVSPVRAVQLQVPAALISVLIGTASLLSSLAALPFTDLWSVVGAVSGNFAIFGILFSWHWLMGRFWFRLFPAHGYGPTQTRSQAPAPGHD